MYNINEDKWEIMEGMVSERGGLAATSLKKSVFVFGGESRVKTFNNNEQFSSIDNIWIIREEMPTARHGLVAISYNFSIFVIGGGTEPGYSMSGLNEVFTPIEFQVVQDEEKEVIPQVNNVSPEQEEKNQVDIVSEIADPFDSCQLVDECLSPSEERSSRIIYYIFIILIVILLTAIAFTLISLYRYTKLDKNKD